FYFACLKQNEEVVYLNNPQCEKCFCQLYTAIYQHEIREKNALIIFPNPAIDKMTIRFNESGLSANRLIIYNSMGMKISERTINKYPEIEILVDKFNSGLHTIQIFNKDNKILGMKKFIIE
ncbi:MAG: T9SS type A sorting domain-containing protein, partial [Desulfobacula sp.]|nr:T9SS type A sorting domain-containing protein [Desulfobacula sp.]